MNFIELEYCFLKKSLWGMLMVTLLKLNSKEYSEALFLDYKNCKE